MKREEIFEYVKKQYGTIPEYFWKSSFRRTQSSGIKKENRIQLCCETEKSKLGLKEEGSEISSM